MVSASPRVFLGAGISTAPRDAIINSQQESLLLHQKKKKNKKKNPNSRAALAVGEMIKD